MNFQMLLLVSVFGGLGAVLRFVVDTIIKRMKPTIFPISTLVINTLAAFAFGCFVMIVRNVHPDVYTIATSGLLGGFSTFSTAINEIFNLARDKHWTQFVIYLFTAIIVPIVGFILAVYLMGFLPR
ncbi:fluoride efflux transporter FluC [Alloscardovia venturai]|uniref:Fluoride-specific ion channel FluC n=1 Tax=Alloscardovia venturai TaxID=1769421 RepID=A0ABW2Y3X0_9BIFI